jgi:hypothetical protein
VESERSSPNSAIKLSKQNSIDVYLECKECAAIPIWDTKTKDGNQEVFDHYQ